MTISFTIDSWGQFFGIVFLIYLGLTFVFTVFLLIHMEIVERKANAKKMGRERKKELISKGRFRQVPLYTPEEIRKKKALEVVRLSIFQSDRKEKSKVVIVCPGGGYTHLCTDTEGYPVAARINEMGYTAMVLEYRTGFHCSKKAPMHDLARAVRYMYEHADELNIDPEGYALLGFSAGGNLVGIYGSEAQGYGFYETAKPGTIILGYPWTNVNHWIRHPYWNIWQGLIGIWFSERCNLFMFGIFNTRKNRDSICVQNWITESYPNVYMFAGGQDVLVPAAAHTDVLHKALKENQVEHVYQRYFRVPHGIGLGIGTEAESWLDEAIIYWRHWTHQDAE